MSDLEQIQRLIRLKRHEQPPEGFVDDFVSSFQQRQRAELLNNSARGLLWERVTTYFDGLLAPKWGWAAATAVVLVGAFALVNQGSPAGVNTIAGTKSADQVAAPVLQIASENHLAPISDEEIRQYLLNNHYNGGFGNEVPNAGITSVPSAPQGVLVPVGGSGF